jgi:hypothetical protein
VANAGCHAQEDAEEAAALGILHALDRHYRALLLPAGLPEAAPRPPPPPLGVPLRPARAVSPDGCCAEVGGPVSAVAARVRMR